MDEQNNQNYENQKPEVKNQETELNSKKAISKMVIIIGAIAVVIVAIVVVLIILLGGKHEHLWSEGNTIYDGDCDDYGKRTYICNECGETKVATVGARGHYFGDWIKLYNDCTVGGDKERTCNVCGYKETTQESAVTNHNFANWITTKEETCSTDGIRERVCKNCEVSETEIIAAMHSYSYTNAICEKCNQAWISMPILPYAVTSSDSIINISSLEIDLNRKTELDVYVKFYWSGEKIADLRGNNYQRLHEIIIKLYDEDDYLVGEFSAWTPKICVGEKFKNKETTLELVELDPQKMYRIVIIAD